MAVLAGLPIATACGSDDDSLSKDEFIEQGDKICKAFDEETDAFDEPQSEEELEGYFDQLIALAEDTRVDFAALEPPGDGEDVHQALLGSLDDAIDIAGEARDAAAAGDLEEMQTILEEADEKGDAVDEQADEYGFEECGS